MPPKGWRKYPDGNKEGPTAPQSNSKKDEMYSVEVSQYILTIIDTLF